MFGIDEDERNVSTGVVELKLSVLDLPLQPFGGWLYLQDQNKVSLTCLACVATSRQSINTYTSNYFHSTALSATAKATLTSSSRDTELWLQSRQASACLYKCKDARGT